MFAKIGPKFSMSVVEGGTTAVSRALDNVEAKTFKSRDFRLQNGEVLPELKIAYETYGKLAPDGRNAVLITHGYTASPHVAGRYKASDPAPGNWDALIGPGKAIDTERYFVVSSNNLGSSYGSSSPRDIDPATGKPYGPDFPHHVTLDTIAAQKLLLEHLGVKHLVAVIGWSYGGGLAFLWGVTYPDFVDAIVPTVSAPVVQYSPSVIGELTARLATDPNWNGGRYYENGGIERVLTGIRIETVKRYGIEAELAPRFPDAAAREAEIRRRAEAWAKIFDGNSLIALRRATLGFDAEKDFSKLRAKVLYVLCTTDLVYPTKLAPAVMSKLKAAGVDAEYFELDSPYGHMAPALDAPKWAPTLKRFLNRVSAAK